MHKVSKNPGETSKIAKVFLDRILKKDRKPGALVVCLSGDLGAGKTAFTKAVGKHLGIKQEISSPTFVIMKKYPIKLEGYKFFFHLDAYRLEHEKELQHLGWEEIVSDKDNLVFIEWPENVSKVIPAGSRFIYIKSDKNGHRNLKLK